MQYHVALRKNNKKSDFSFHYFEELDFYPQSTIEKMEVIFISENMDICQKCELGNRCHIIVSKSYEVEMEDGRLSNKLCPILFYDLFKPDWKLEELC